LISTGGHTVLAGNPEINPSFTQNAASRVSPEKKRAGVEFHAGWEVSFINYSELFFLPFLPFLP
jgi:hypothetical protein